MSAEQLAPTIVDSAAEPGTAAHAPLRPIRRRKIHEEVASRMQELIAELGLQPGDQLPAERELMAEFGVGRSAVREAMLALQRMGIVSVSSGERARVAKPTARAMVEELSGVARLVLGQPGGVQQFQDARALLEIGLARYAAERATAADLDMLAALLEANREAGHDHASFMRTDVAFHHGIAIIARNDIFTALMEAVVAWLTEQRQVSGLAPGAAEAAYAAHKRIFEAIASRDPDVAGRAMQDHLAAVTRLYWQIREPTQPA
jgi:DNA-binding FadR family transcriptional regulator